MDESAHPTKVHPALLALTGDVDLSDPITRPRNTSHKALKRCRKDGSPQDDPKLFDVSRAESREC